MRGFSLLEIIIAVAIIAILLAISVVAYSAFLDRQRLNKAAEEVVTIIQKARAMTVSSYNSAVGATFGKQYCIWLSDFDDTPVEKRNTVVLRIDDVAFPGETVESYTVSEGVIMQSLLLIPPDDNRNVCFKRLSGDAFVRDVGTEKPLSSATITLRSQSSGKERTVTVSPTGVVQAQ